MSARFNTPQLDPITAVLRSDEIATDLRVNYKARVRHLYRELVHALGEKLRDVRSNWTWCGAFQQIQPCLVQDREWRWWIDEEKLHDMAVVYAEETVEAWIGKIARKLGPVDTCEISSFSATRFDIYATRCDHHIRLIQSCILQRSSKGKLFNQFPALLYVDGKFTAEKAYKAMFKTKLTDCVA
jgi:hypothetical protein